MNSLRKKINYHKNIAMDKTTTEKKRNRADIKWTAALEEKDIYFNQYSEELSENRLEDTDKTNDTRMCDVDMCPMLVGIKTILMMIIMLSITMTVTSTAMT